MANKPTLSADGKSFIPTSFTLKSAELYNHAGDMKIINDLIDSITIKESLSFPTLIADITIGDAINFLESFALIGQESIVLEFEKAPVVFKDIQTVRIEFFISEYPEYERSATNAAQQAYTMRGITPYAYNSKFQKISRAYKGSAIEQISRIVKKDLFYSNLNINGLDQSNHRGIINSQEPLSAVEYFRKMAYDENGAPFFFYQTIDGSANLVSLSALLGKDTNPVYETYVYLKNYISDPFTTKDYIERAIRIRQVSSSLGLSKLAQGANGGYASKTRVLDIGRKVYLEKIYNYAESKVKQKTLAGENKNSTLLSTSFKIGRNQDNSLNTLPDAHTDNLSINDTAFGDTGTKNYTTELASGIGRMNSFYSKLNTMTHRIEVAGDFNLKCGRKIRLLFPKAIEEAANKAFNPENVNTDHIDTLQSGNYLITAVNHHFKFKAQENVYLCELQCKKDSVFTEI
tara:strand:- start:1 stop:1380 length:1380 start_codon:yes stop_codon:yes gene_type:complete